MQEAARKMGVQPTKPEGYDSLYAKYAPDDDQEFDANILGTLNQATGSVDTFENGSIFPPPKMKLPTKNCATKPVFEKTKGAEHFACYPPVSVGSSNGGLAPPSNLHESIDRFLCSKGPSIGDAQNLRKGVSLPKLRQELSTMRKVSSGIVESAHCNTMIKPRPRVSSTSGEKRISEGFDYGKLQEAMDYASQFEMQIDERSLLTSETGSRTRKRTQNKIGLREKKGIKNARSRRDGRRGKKVADSLQFYRVKAGEDRGGKKGKLLTKNMKAFDNESQRGKRIDNVESLVENFEKGLMLQQLRAQLQESQQSMNASKQFISQSMSVLQKR